MWLHQSSCEHSTLDVWTCLTGGSESSSLSQTTGCHRSYGTKDWRENLFSACKHKTNTWDKDFSYLTILGSDFNAAIQVSRKWASEPPIFPFPVVLTWPNKVLFVLFWYVFSCRSMGRSILIWQRKQLFTRFHQNILLGFWDISQINKCD